MNLKKIADKKEDYQDLISVSPGNLYFALAQKAAKYITVQNNKSPINLSWNILGNKVNFYYGNNKVNLVVGGKRYTGEGANLKALEDALYNLFQGELKGEIELQRPEGRSFLNDRNDFNKASGTCFPKLYKSVAWDKEGKKNSEVLGSRSNAIALTEKQYKNASLVPTFKASNFKEISEGGVHFYLNKSSKFINFDNAKFIEDKEPVELTESQFFRVLTDQDSNLGMWSRTKEFSRLNDNIESYYNTAVLYKGRVWLVIPSQFNYQVKPFI